MAHLYISHTLLSLSITHVYTRTPLSHSHPLTRVQALRNLTSCEQGRRALCSDAGDSSPTYIPRVAWLLAHCADEECLPVLVNAAEIPSTHALCIANKSKALSTLAGLHLTTPALGAYNANAHTDADTHCNSVLLVLRLFLALLQGSESQAALIDSCVVCV
jgi:hypothetical protein